MTTFHFAGVPWPLRIVRTPLRETARRFFALWPHRYSGAEEGPSVADAPGGGYCCRPGDRTVCESTEAAFLCSLSIEMVLACCAARPDLLRLHAAAVAGHGRGLLLCGGHQAGKSVLTARLIADGWTGYGDDMVAVTRAGNLFSFGIAPRLRLPLPPSAVLRSFVLARRGCGDASAVYLDAARSGTAAWGKEHALHAVVMLRRVASGPARLRRLEASEGTAALLRRSLFDAGQAEATLQAACDLAGRVPCVQLSYADADRAAQRLTLWARQGLPLPPPARAPFAGEGGTRLEQAREQADADEPSRRFWRQATGIAFRRVGLEGYLTDARGTALYRLTPLGCALWRMLEQPLSEAQAAALLDEAYPHAGRRRIARDVRVLFDALRARGLTVPADDDGEGRASGRERGGDGASMAVKSL